MNVLGFAGSELVRADKHGCAVACHIERVRRALLDGLAVGLGLKKAGGNAEFVCQFLMPLLAQVGRGDDENPTLALCPALGDQQPGFNRFAQADFISKDGTLGQWIAGREQRRVYLVRIEINLSVQQCACHAIHRIGSGTAGELVREVSELVRTVGHQGIILCMTDNTMSVGLSCPVMSRNRTKVDDDAGSLAWHFA